MKSLSVPDYHFPPLSVFSPRIQNYFEEAGWIPGRIADPPVRLPNDIKWPPLLELLREYEGLIVRGVGKIRFEPVMADSAGLQAYA